MHSDELKALFEQQACSYDERWAKTAPIRDALHLLLTAVFASLPADARIVCVGAGTGHELEYLAMRFPHWTFAVVEPAGAMLEICRHKAAQGGFESRCQFHQGYLDTLANDEPFTAATCFLVSQFILDQKARADFFRTIACRLVPGGIMASSDLAADVDSRDYDALLQTWLNLMSTAGVPAAGLEQMRAAYAKDVAILPPAQVADILRSGGFAEPVQFYQAGLIHAWYSRSATSNSAR